MVPVLSPCSEDLQLLGPVRKSTGVAVSTITCIAPLSTKPGLLIPRRFRRADLRNSFPLVTRCGHQRSLKKKKAFRRGGKMDFSWASSSAFAGHLATALIGERRDGLWCAIFMAHFHQKALSCHYAVTRCDKTSNVRTLLSRTLFTFSPRRAKSFFFFKFYT